MTSESDQSPNLYLPAALALDTVLLALMFSAPMSVSLVAPVLAASFTLSTVPVVAPYLRGGRLHVSAGLFLLGLVALYTIPVTLFEFLSDPSHFAGRAPAALLLATGQASVALAVTLFDKPGTSPELAAAIARHQVTLLFASFALLGMGVVWITAALGGPSGAYRYLFDLSYFEKHVYFQGAALLGLFSMCFEVAGLLAVVVAAVPRSIRRVSLIWPLIPVLIMTAAVANQGYRSPIVLAAGLYAVCRSLWPDHAVKARNIVLSMAALAPIFLLWAYVRPEISSAGIAEVDVLRSRAASADWTNLRESEVATMFSNAEELIKLIDHRGWHFTWGETLVFGPLDAMVPTWFWRNRPDGLQIAFTRAIAPEFEAGGTKSFSFILEGYLNFGLPGVALWSVAVTGAAIALQRLAERIASRDQIVRAMIILSAITVIWFYIRDDFGDLVRRTFLTSAIAVAGVLAGDVLVAGWRGLFGAGSSARLPDRQEHR